MRWLAFAIPARGLVSPAAIVFSTRKLGAAEGRALRRWLAAQAKDIDWGTALLPEAFLATRSVSMHPRAVARIANAPYHALLRRPGRAFADVDFGVLTLSQTPAALTRRLNQMSCKGCHATRSLAGFHVLGEDRPSAHPYNAVAVGFSPHLLGELPWRRRYLVSVAAGSEAQREPRPFPERGESQHSFGAACGLGDPSFDAWCCSQGEVCVDRLHDAVGRCAALGPQGVGGGVETGRLQQDLRGRRDRIRQLRLAACAAIGDQKASVARSKNGFPAGMCHAPCRRFGAIQGDAICGPLPFGKGTDFGGFTRCLAQRKHSFATCLKDDAHPTWLRRCDVATPCRDDYLCAKVPGSERSGACVPPYFLFQVRVDGHLL